MIKVFYYSEHCVRAGHMIGTRAEAMNYRGIDPSRSDDFESMTPAQARAVLARPDPGRRCWL